MPVVRKQGLGSYFGGANEVIYVNSSGVLSQDSGFEYYASLPGGSIEYGFGLTRTLSRSTSESTQTTLLQSTLTTTDTLTFGNDSSTEMKSADFTYYVGGTVNANGSIVAVNYMGFKGSVFNQGILTLKGDSDSNYGFYGASGTVNLTNISVPTDGGDVNIFTYGGYFSASAQIIVTAPSNPFTTHTGVAGVAIKSGGSAVQVCRGGVFTGSGATTNYGVFLTGSTAAAMAVGHYLFNAANTYDVADSTNYARAMYTKRIDLSTATTSSDGVVIGGGRFYQSTASSGSGSTLVNPVVSFITSNLLVTAPTHTSTTATENGLSVTKRFTPNAASIGRARGLNFNVSGTGSNGSSDATSGVVGVEGTVSLTGSGTWAAVSAGIFFNSIGSGVTVTRYAGIDGYGPDTSGGGTCTEGAGVVARFGRASSSGTHTANWAIQTRAATVSGTGVITAQYGLATSTGGGMNAITANTQTRKYIEVPSMPDPGAFTGTTIYGIDFLGTGGTARDGIRFGGDVELFRSAVNVLRVGAGDAFRSDTGIYSPLHRPDSNVAMVVRGRDTGDDGTVGGAGSDLTVRAGDGATSKPTGAGGNLIFRCTNGSAFGSMTFYKVNGTTKLQEFTDTGVGWFASTPVAQQNGTGETVGFTAGAGTNVTDASTFTGNVGATAYRISDIVKALKNYGLLAA